MLFRISAATQFVLVVLQFLLQRLKGIQTMTAWWLAAALVGRSLNPVSSTAGIYTMRKPVFIILLIIHQEFEKGKGYALIRWTFP